MMWDAFAPLPPLRRRRRVRVREAAVWGGGGRGVAQRWAARVRRLQRRSRLCR
jgi:hypothetical protein